MMSSEARSVLRAAFHAPERCLRYRADASMGEMRATSGGACHGSSAAVRSTPVWLNQLLADATSRVGIFAPCARANSPAAYAAFLSQGSASEPAGNSSSLATYIKDGRSDRDSMVPGAVN